MDFSHFPFVHEGLLGTRDRAVVSAHEVVATDHGLTYAFEQPEPSTVHSGLDELVRWEYHLYLPFTIHLRKVTPDGRATVISMAATPTDPERSHRWVWILRHYDLDPAQDQRFREFTQDHGTGPAGGREPAPERIPLDLREELHLKVPDASGIAFRGTLSQIAEVTPFLP